MISNKLKLNYNPNISEKKFSLQFLPERMIYLSDIKKIDHKGLNLKTNYIIDIIHNLILKYYFKNENLFALNSIVLKEKYGHLYNHYIQYLVDYGIIVMRKNYLKGSSSRKYSLNEEILNEKILRFKNFDKFLLKKFISRYNRSEIDSKNLIKPEIKDKLISDLYSVNIQYDKSIFYLDSLKNEDISIYNRNSYSVDSIDDKHIFYHFDNYGRLHSNFTILKTFIRKNCLLIDGEETYEKDLSNSQPFFLYNLIKKSESRWVDVNELELFGILVRNGNYYNYLIDNLKLKDKKDSKELTYKVLFGKNHKNSKFDKKFQLIFPTIHNFIKLYKKEHDDYKFLSYKLQRMESNLIFNEIIDSIMKINSDIKIITIHDSIICQKKYKDIVNQIFDSKVDEVFNSLY